MEYIIVTGTSGEIIKYKAPWHAKESSWLNAAEAF